MLEEMQKLSLAYLWSELNKYKSPPEDLRNWFITEKKQDRGRFFSYLVEPTGKIDKFYTLSADHCNTDIAILEGVETASLGNSAAELLPFNRPSGAQSPQIGPVIKRSYSNKGAGPSEKILNTTLKSFKDKASSKEPWSCYFKSVVDTYTRSRISYSGNIIDCKKSSLLEAVQIIPNNKNTVFLVFKTADGKLPGAVKEYKEYLSTMLDGGKKYTIAKAQAIDVSSCSCCLAKNVKGFAAGLSKAGINIFNNDREGAFPGISAENAYLSYSICEDCADLLYIFKFHVMDKYLTYISGNESILIPDIYLSPDLLQSFLKTFQEYANELKNDQTQTIAVEKENKRLLKVIAREKAVCSIDIIWSGKSLKGQKIEELSGLITDVLPSRLNLIEQKNKAFEENNNSPFSPKHRVDGFNFDLNLSFMGRLFFRPGGKAAKSVNNSKKFYELKRLLTESIYKKRKMPHSRFWEEVMITANWYIRGLHEKEKPARDCLYEGYSEKKNEAWMTLAGWIRHLAVSLEYLTFLEVMEYMGNKRTYYPEMENLKKYFEKDSGINSDEKAFAFILGMLFGRVMQIQGAKGVNVNANALTWLKRLTLTGKDLPEFYVKVREKLLAYDAEKVETVRTLIKEVGRLGIKEGDDIGLDQVSCCYFLLLGQSITVDLFPAKSGNI